MALCYESGSPAAMITLHDSVPLVTVDWNRGKQLAQAAAAAAAKSLQSCPTLRGPIDGSPPGSPVPGILQARTLEWAAIAFSSAGKWKVKVKSLSRVRLLVTSWTAAHQALPSMGFSRQEYWSGVALPSPWLSLFTTFTMELSPHDAMIVFSCSRYCPQTNPSNTYTRANTWLSCSVHFSHVYLIFYIISFFCCC